MKRFYRCNSGAALIELALTVPIVLVLLAGTVEFSRLAIIQMKLNKAATAMSDFVTQGKTVKISDLNGFAGAMNQIMKPFAFSGSVIFSSVATNQGNTGSCSGANRTCVVWQHRAMGTDNSQIGAVTATPVLPGAFAPKNGQDIIVSEVYYNYAPLLPVTSRIITSLAARKLYNISITKPRQGTLTTLTP